MMSHSLQSYLPSQTHTDNLKHKQKTLAYKHQGVRKSMPTLCLSGDRVAKIQRNCFSILSETLESPPN